MRRRIPSQALILVCDGRKALFLRNMGDAQFPNLAVAEVLKAKPNPPTSKQGTDKPGRVLDRASGRHSAVDQTDWHMLEEDHFAREIASALQLREQAGEVSSLIVVAPPHILAELRALFPHRLKAAVVEEIHKDLTKHPIYEIERLLTER